VSGIYIPGMEMPKRGEFSHIRIYDNGEVTIESGGVEYPVAKAVAVPDHGRLVDADALKARVQKLQEWLWDKLTDADVGIVTEDDIRYRIAEESEEFIDDAPTIIPADKGGDDDV